MISRFQTAVDYGISPALFGEPEEDTYSSFRKINTPEGPRVVDTRKHTLQNYEAPAKRRRVEVEDAYKRTDRPSFRVRPPSPVQRTSPTPARVLRDISGYAKYGETLLDQPELEEDESELPDILGADNFDDDDDQSATEDVLDALFGRDTDQHQILDKLYEKESISTKEPEVPQRNVNAERHSVGYVNDELLSRIARQTAAENKLHSVLQDEIRRSSLFKENQQNMSSKKPYLSDELRLGTDTGIKSKDQFHDLDLSERRDHANDSRTTVADLPEPADVAPVANSPRRQQLEFKAKLLHTTTPPRPAVPLHNHKDEVEVQSRRRSEGSDFNVIEKKKTIVVESSQRLDGQRSPASKLNSFAQEHGHLPMIAKEVEHQPAQQTLQVNEELIDEDAKARSDALDASVVQPLQRMSPKPSSPSREIHHQTLAEAIFEDDLMKSFDEVSDLEYEEQQQQQEKAEARQLETRVDEAIENVLEQHEEDAAHLATSSSSVQSHATEINDDKEINEPVQILHPTEVQEIAEDEEEPEYEGIEEEEEIEEIAEHSSLAGEEVAEEDEIEIDELDDSYPDEVAAAESIQEEVTEDRRRSITAEQPNALQPVETETEEVYDEEKENRIPSSPAIDYEEQVQSAGSPVEVQVYEDEDNIALEDQASPGIAEPTKEEGVTVVTEQNERVIDDEERELDKSLIDEVEMMTTEYQDDITERRRWSIDERRQSSNGRKESSTSERSHIKHQVHQTSYEAVESDYMQKPASPASDEEEQALDQLLMEEVDAFEDADSAMSVEKENNGRVPPRRTSLLPRTPSPLFDNQIRERLQSGYMGQPRSALEVIRDTLSQSQLPTPPRNSPKVKVTKGQEVLLKRMETTELNRSAAQLQSSYDSIRPNRPGPQRELNEMDVVAEAINEVITPYQYVLFSARPRDGCVLTQFQLM